MEDQFDNLVIEVNDWIKKSENIFFRIFLRKHPIYGNDKLSENQKDAVLLASDVMRIGDKLSKNDLKLKSDLYVFFKNKFLNDIKGNK